MKKSVLSISSIAVLFVIFLLLNSLSSSLLSRFTVDLTEDGLYSLSDGTKKILDGVDEPLVIRYYFSEIDSVRNAGVQLYATRVRDLLREYARYSGGTIQLEEYNPQPDSEEEEWAANYGLQAIGLPTGERLYFGMVVTDSEGEEEVIPVFNINRQETLEYDITKSIYSLVRTESPVIGVLSPLELAGEGPQTLPNGMPAGPGRDPWVLVSQLESLGDVKILDSTIEVVPEEVNVLLVLHPKGFSEATQYAIDQYVLKGGSLFLAVDPYCASDSAGIDPNNPMAMVQADRSSSLGKLAKNWGIHLKGKEVVGDPVLATKVNAGRGQPPQNFLVWLSIGEQSDTVSGKPLLNREQVVTSQINNLLFAWPGALRLESVEGVVHTPLVQTTSKAGFYEEQKIRFMAQNPPELMRAYASSGEQQLLAVMARGRFKSAFEGKPGQESTAVSEVGGHIPESIAEANVIVVSDADFLANSYSAVIQNVMGYNLVSLINENLAFALNSVELLSGSNELIALRSRGSFLRPFTKVQEIEAAAQSRWRAEELVLQKQADEASKRLQQLQSVGVEAGAGQEAVFSQALMEEIRGLRERRREAESKLREVRYQLRKDKESLGNWLFALNTFAVPLLIILGTLYFNWRNRQVKA